MKRLFPILILFITQNIKAQSGAEYIAIGKNMANNAASFGLANNPGYLPENGQFLGVFGQNRFTGTKISNGGIVYSNRKSNNSWGLQSVFSGTSYFYQSDIQAGYSLLLSENFNLGLSLGLNSLNMAGIETSAEKHALSGKIGGSYSLKKWTTSFVLVNPWNNQSEIISRQPSLHLSAGYQVNGITKVYAQYRKDKAGTDAVGVALDYKAGKSFRFLASMQTGVEPFSAGLVYNNHNLKFSLATAYHTYLGFSPAFSLAWQLSKK